MRFPRSAALAGLILAVSPMAAQGTLTQRIDQRLSAAGLDRNLWGIAVTDLQGTILYDHNAKRLFTPASNTKLAVTTAALSILGPNFTTVTSLYATTPAVGGVIAGDLVLYGRGDPTFSRRCYDADSTKPGACERDPSLRLRDLARQLQSRGITTIRGDLVADGTWFEMQRVHPTWENYDIGWYFAAPVSALAFNDNAIDVHTTATTVGKAPNLTVMQSNGASMIINAVTGAAGSPKTFDIFRSPDGQSYIATGSLPLGASSLEYPAVIDPDIAAAVALRRELSQVGITVAGRIRGAPDSMTTLAARHTDPLAEVRSRPLSEWLFPILGASQNLFAEMLLKQLGRSTTGDGSWRAGISAERRFLIDVVRLDSTQFSLADGSGLSTKNLLTPVAFTTMLRFLWTHPNKELVLHNLPQSGHPGTLLHRFVGTPLDGRVHAKSGAVGGVNALSGFVERPDGQVLVFSIIANNHLLGSAKMIAAIDSIILELGR